VDTPTPRQSEVEVTLANVTTHEMAQSEYRRDLGNGLVLRWSTPDDVERVVELYAQVFRQNADAPLNAHIPNWTRDMFSGRHPYIGPHEFAVAEDTASGKLVASTCLIRYTCAYEGIAFQFGRPEVVASLPEYRRQGLIRAIFELIHARSDERGDLAQGITGIEYYYRQFGYEYAATLDEAGLSVYFPAIPPLKPGTPEPYALREAALDDVPLLQRFWTLAHAHAALWTDIEDGYWRWVIAGMHPDAMERWRPYLITEASGHPVGALLLMPGRWSIAAAVHGPMLDAGVPLVQVMPSVLRGLQSLAETTRPIRPETPPTAGALRFRWSGPALRGALGDIQFSETEYPYAWYLRVANVPGFLRHVAPVLERRLAESAEAGYTGELLVDFYRGGLRLALEKGKLTAVEDWQRPLWGEAKAGFPPLVFLQLLFGYRSLDELRRIYPDVWAAGEATALLNALFPRRPSMLVPLD
jgi:hypothetical protein